MKQCHICRESKPLDEFHKRASAKDGLQNRCKTCAIRIAREWYGANRERAAAKVEAWQAANPDKVREIKRRNKVATKYGLTWSEYQALIAVRGEVCWICGTDDPGRSGMQRMAVDHDHATSEVRGLLCDACNNGLGKFKDDIDRMKAAMQYLESA